MTFKGLINAEYSFGVLGDKVKELWDKVTASDGFASVWDKILSLVDRVPGIAITCILLALSLVQVFAGKRLLSIQKFLAFFAVGFACGAALLAPLLPDMIKIDGWIIGLVVALLAAILSGLLYFVVYIVAAGYSVYLVCMGGYYLPATITSFTKGNMMIALVAAAVVIVLALIFSKFIEMAATSALGGWCTALCAIELLGKAGVTLEGKTLTIVKLAIIGVFFIAGTIVQFKTRKRY